MNTQIVAKTKKPKKLSIFLSSLLLIFSFCVHFIYKYTVSQGKNTEIVKEFQMIFKQGSNLFKYFILIGYVLSSDYMMYIIISLVHNFSNVYKSFLLFNLVSFGYTISAILKYSFSEYLPFNNDNSIQVYYCDLGWGLPSSQLLIIVPFYLTVWKIICTRKNKDVNVILKYTLLVLILLFFVYIFMVNLLNGTHYLNHVIFSFLFGLGIYFLLFHGLNINILEGKEFHSLIKRKLWIYLLIHIIPYIIILVLFLVFVYQTNSTPLFSCIGEVNFYSDNISGYEYFTKGTFMLSVYVLPNFLCFLGVKMEMHYLFNDNYINWMQFNFSSDECEIDDSMSMMSISITKDTKWNNTNFMSALLRIFVLLILCCIAYIPFFVIKSNANFYLIYFVKLELPLCLFSFGIFFLFKMVLSKTRCINGALFSMIQDK